MLELQIGMGATKKRTMVKSFGINWLVAELLGAACVSRHRAALIFLAWCRSREPECAPSRRGASPPTQPAPRGRRAGRAVPAGAHAPPRHLVAPPSQRRPWPPAIRTDSRRRGLPRGRASGTRCGARRARRRAGLARRARAPRSLRTTQRAARERRPRSQSRCARPAVPSRPWRRRSRLRRRAPTLARWPSRRAASTRPTTRHTRCRRCTRCPLRTWSSRCHPRARSGVLRATRRARCSCATHRATARSPSRRLSRTRTEGARPARSRCCRRRLG